MLKIYRYHHFFDCYQWSLLKNYRYIVCPTADVADAFRRGLFLHSAQAKKEQSPEVVTFSFFLSLLQRQSFSQSKMNRALRKSEILTKLVNSIPCSELSLNAFRKAFNRLSELRGFTLESGVLHELCCLFEQQETKILLQMQAIFSELDLWDEHRLAQELKLTIEDPAQSLSLPSFALFGVSHLTGQQVDWIEQYSRKASVSIFISEGNWQQRKFSHWVCWLPEQDQLVESAEGPEKKNSFSSQTAASLEMNDLGVKWFEEREAPSAQILLAQQTSELASLLHSPFSAYFPQCSSSMYQLWMQKFHHQFDAQKDQRPRYDKPYLKEVWSKVLAGIDSAQRPFGAKLSARFYRFLQELTGEVVEQTQLQLFWEVAELDSPRIYHLQLSQQLHHRSYLLPELIGLDLDVPTLYLGFAESDPCTPSARNSETEDLSAALFEIGPLYDPNWRAQTVQDQIKTLSEFGTVHFIFEQTMVQKNQFYSEILNGAKTIPTEPGRPKDHLLTIEKRVPPPLKLSPSRMQTFLDCPFKYYLNYEKKLSPMATPASEFGANERGSIVHEVIRLFFERPKKLEAILSEQIRLHNKDRKSPLDSLRLKTEFIILRPYCESGIRQLQSVLKSFSGKLLFELPLRAKRNEGVLTGRPDLMIQGDWGLGLIDLKSSDASIPSQKDVRECQSIQLPFYHYLLRASTYSNHSLVFQGYLCLSSPRKSLFFTESDEQKKTMKELLPRASVSTFSMDEELFEQKLADVIQRLENATEIYPSPRSEKVCSWCDHRLFCPRQEEGVSYRGSEQ